MPKNKSEILLEGYLRSHGYEDFDFEPEISGATKRPDYRLRWDGGEVLLEVKEFRGTDADFTAGAGFFDPYPPLREKIDQGRDKFQKMKQHCCCLVLHNVNKPLVFLDWTHVYFGEAFDWWTHMPLELDAARWTMRDPARRPLRVVVHENPYARIPLPAELFCGPWDERYGERDGRIQQLFIGEEVVRLPAKE